MNYPPIANYLGVTPNNGQEINTQFTLTVYSPIDIDNNYPLTYSFGYFSKGQYFFISSLSQSPTFTFTLTYIEKNLILFVRIYDSLGDYSEYTTLVTLQINTNFDPLAYYNQQTQSNFIFYPEMPLIVANMINSVLCRSYYLTGKYSNAQLLQNSFTYVINMIEQYINLSISSSNNVDQVVSMIYSLTSNPYLISDENASNTKKELSLLYGLNSNEGISTSQGQQAIIIANNSLVLDRVKMYNDTNGVYTIIQILDSTVTAMINQLIPYQQYILNSTKIEVNVETTDLKSLSKFSISSYNYKNVFATFPDNFVLSNMSSSDQLVVSLGFLNSIPDKKFSTPTVVSLDLYSFSNSSHISVSNLKNPVNISIPIYNINVTDIKCYYLNTDTRR